LQSTVHKTSTATDPASLKQITHDLKSALSKKAMSTLQQQRAEKS